VHTPTLAGVLTLCLTGLLLGGCESDHRDATEQTQTSLPSSAPSDRPAPPSATAVPPPVTRGPAPPVSEVTRLVVDSPDDPTTVTVDVPPARGGYVVAAGCDGPPGASVSWTVTRTVGPVGAPAGEIVPCDGAEHSAGALPGTPVAVQVRLRLDVDRSAVSSAWAILQEANG
jgi:hypothetical protein